MSARRLSVLLLILSGCASGGPAKAPPKTDDVEPDQPDAAAPKDARARLDVVAVGDQRTDSPDGGTGALDAEPPAATTCPAASPVRLPANSAELQLPVRILAGGKPAQPNLEVTRGDQVGEKLARLHFFLAEPYLRDGRGRWVPAQWTDGHGTPLPYGLALVDLETTATIALAAPPGRYVGLHVGVGVPAPCNTGDPTKRVAPLNADGDMYWSWGAQYLFIRLDGFQRAPGGTVWAPLELHLGFDAAYRTTLVAGALDVGGAAAGPTLVFDVDGLIQPPGPDVEGIGGIAAPDWVLDHITGGKVLSFVP